jgi:agmatinase
LDLLFIEGNIMNITRIFFTNSNKSTKDCENSSEDILRELRGIKVNEKGKIIDFNKIIIDEIKTNTGDSLEDILCIFEESRDNFEKHNKSFFLGGDHSITCPILLGFKKTEASPLVLVFDSHADCKLGKDLNNKNWVRRVVEEGYNPERIVLISSRDIDEEELKFIKENRILIIKIDFLKERIEEICDVLMERARKATGFYMSIDIDSVDPAYAPGTFDYSPGGLSSRELIYLVKRLSLLDNFKGADIVEVVPKKDIGNMTVKLAAKLVAEMM